MPLVRNALLRRINLMSGRSKVAQVEAVVRSQDCEERERPLSPVSRVCVVKGRDENNLGR